MLKKSLIGLGPRSCLALSIVALMLAVSSCGLVRRGSGTAPEDMRVRVDVVNRNIYQATLYSMVEGARLRIGTVEGNSSASLSAPFPPGGRMSVEVRLAVGSYSSMTVDVSPGGTVHVDIPANLHQLRDRFPR
jgi:hypothetical protein